MNGRTIRGEAREVRRVQLAEARTDRARRTARHGKATRRSMRETQYAGRRTA
jgi:hypothetical protein